MDGAVSISNLVRISFLGNIVRDSVSRSLQVTLYNTGNRNRNMTETLLVALNWLIACQCNLSFVFSFHFRLKYQKIIVYVLYD